MNKKFDVVIVGGGFVGLSLACALAPLSLSIAIIEASDSAQKKDSRYLALHYGSQQFLDQLGVWPLLSTSAFPIKAVHISQQGHFNKLRFFAEEESVPALAQMVAAQQLLTSLYQRAQSFDNIHFFQPASLSRLEHQQRQLHIHYQGKQGLLNYRLLVAADGARSLTRKSLGICANSEKVGAALLCLLAAERHCQTTAYQRFSSAGTLALLPVNRQQYKAVISADGSQIASWQALDDQQFIKKFQQHFSFFAGNFHSVTPRVSYPIEQLSVEQQVMEGAVIVGNAAHTFSPVAAQGLNLSLQDVAVLADVLLQARSEDFSSLLVLSRYQQQRQASQRNITQFMRVLTANSKQQHKLAITARTLSFMAGQWCLPLHHHFAKSFAGIQRPL